MWPRSRIVAIEVLVLLALSALGLGQSTGTITGVVRGSDGAPAHHAAVMIVQTGETVETDHEGRYKIDNLPPGTYDIFSYVFSAQLFKFKLGLLCLDFIELSFRIA